MEPTQTLLVLPLSTEITYGFLLLRNGRTEETQKQMNSLQKLITGLKGRVTIYDRDGGNVALMTISKWLRTNGKKLPQETIVDDWQLVVLHLSGDHSDAMKDMVKHHELFQLVAVVA